MRGALLKSYGESVTENIVYSDRINVPKPERSEVLVKILGSSINPLDVVMRKGYAKSITDLKLTLPIILGRDCVAEIVELGNDVWDYNVGDLVWAANPPFVQGSHCEYTTLNEADIAKAPKSLSIEQAACVPFAGLTAWNAVVNIAGLAKGSSSDKRVLVNGGAGGVGYFAIQLLKKVLGVGYVVATSSEKSFPLLKEAGADHVIDYRLESYPLQDIDIVFNCFDGGEKILEKCKSTLKPVGGHYIDFNGPIVKSSDREGILVGLPKGILESNVKNTAESHTKYSHSLFVPSGQVLKEISSLFNSKTLETVNFAKKFPLSQIDKAYLHYEDRISPGKIVLDNQI